MIPPSSGRPLPCPNRLRFLSRGRWHIVSLLAVAFAAAALPASGSSPSCAEVYGLARSTPTPAPNPQARARAARFDWNSPLPGLAQPTPQTVSRAKPAGAKTSPPDQNAAVGSILNPSVIDEDFRGFVQLTLSDLPVGATVRVEKYQVNNTSGLIDSTAILQQSFLLTDGQSNAIGGIANSNVPADDTGADGNITAQISFLDESVPTTVAEYVFRISSPTGAFEPMNVRFTVTNVEEAQKVTGTVTADGVPVPHAHVVLLDTSGGGYDFVAATVTDAGGNYGIGAEPGQYDLVAVKRGFVGAFGKGVEHRLTAGVDSVANLTMQPGTRTISGQVRDSANSSQGLPAVQVVFRSDDGKFTVDYTDANGNFSTPVTAGQWEVEVERNAVNQLGYLAPSQGRPANTTAANVSNVAFGLPKATALIHGKVNAENGGGIDLTEVDAGDENAEFEAFTVTDAAGNYVIAVNEGVWFVDATAGALQARGYLSPEPAELFIASGEAKLVNFVVPVANARLIGTLRDANDDAVAEVTFVALETSGTNRFTTFITDADGTFDVPLTNGTWQLVPDPDEAADLDLIFIMPAPFTLSAGQTLANFDLRVQDPTRHIIVNVVDEEGQPYEGLSLEIESVTGGKTYVAYGYTDEEGNAQLPAFDGAWTLFADGSELEADGYRELQPRVINVSGSDPEVQVELELLPASGNTLVNLATRGLVQTEGNVLIGGFIISGEVPKRLLIRAVGPSLGNNGVNNALADTTLTLFDVDGNELAFNDDWMNSTDRQAIIDTTIPPNNEKESAILRTLEPGTYTAQVAGAGSATGIGLVEIYDLDSFASSRLVNIATRGRVETGEDVLIGGYIVGGYKEQEVVVRAIGPSLGTAGVADALADPFLTLNDSNGNVVQSNDNWQDTQRQDLIDAQLAPTNSKESALITTLPAGNYTAVVSGVANGTGVGLVEVYNITPE